MTDEKSVPGDLARKIRRRAKPFFSGHAWSMIILGLILFSLRVQFEPGGWINLPVAFTVLQTAGLMFSIFGLQMMASMTIWPQIGVWEAVESAMYEKNVAAALLVLGLLIFNGLAVLSFVLWITSALGAGVRG